MALAVAASAAQTPVPETVDISAGSFQMGSADGAASEKPVHSVEISAFAVGKHPVTNAEFRAFQPAHQSSVNDNDDAPVTHVSWEDTMEYCRWLSSQTGRHYRLPSEAEWERAARGGLEQKKYPWGDEAPIVLPTPTAEGYLVDARPNPFGLIVGRYNLWEWTADRYSPSYYERSPPKDPPGPDRGDYRVVRGGGSRHDPASMRCARRGSARPTTMSELITFRVAVGLPSTPAVATVSEAKSPELLRPEPEPDRPEQRTASGEVPVPPERTDSTGAVPTEPGGVALLSDVQVEVATEELKVLLVTGGKTKHSTMVLVNPNRLVVDLSHTLTGASGTSSRDVGKAGVLRIRWAQFRREPPVTRVVFDLSGKPEFSVASTPQGPVVRVKTIP